MRKGNTVIIVKGLWFSPCCSVWLRRLPMVSLAPSQGWNSFWWKNLQAYAAHLGQGMVHRASADRPKAWEGGGNKNSDGLPCTPKNLEFHMPRLNACTEQWQGLRLSPLAHVFGLCTNRKRGLRQRPDQPGQVWEKCPSSKPTNKHCEGIFYFVFIFDTKTFQEVTASSPWLLRSWDGYFYEHTEEGNLCKNKLRRFPNKWWLQPGHPDKGESDSQSYHIIIFKVFFYSSKRGWNGLIETIPEEDNQFTKQRHEINCLYYFQAEESYKWRTKGNQNYIWINREYQKKR
jgi:hypothetical protein